MSDFKDIKTKDLIRECPNCGSIMSVDDLLSCQYTSRCCICWICDCGEMTMIDCYYHILNKILIDVINFYITNKKENKVRTSRKDEAIIRSAKENKIYKKIEKIPGTSKTICPNCLEILENPEIREYPDCYRVYCTSCNCGDFQVYKAPTNSMESLENK